jgi:hypothetical protein
MSNWVEVNPPPTPITTPPVLTAQGGTGVVPLPSGTPLAITVTGLTLLGNVTLYFNPSSASTTGAVSVPLQADGNGNLDYNPGLSGSAPGFYMALDQISGLMSNWVQVQGPPTLAASSVPYGNGQALQLKGSGFTPSGSITLYVNPNSKSTGFAYAYPTQQADGNGNWTYTMPLYGPSSPVQWGVSEYVMVQDNATKLQSPWVSAAVSGPLLSINGAVMPHTGTVYLDLKNAVPRGTVTLYQSPKSSGTSVSLNSFTPVGTWAVPNASQEGGVFQLEEIGPVPIWAQLNAKNTYYYVIDNQTGRISPVWLGGFYP